MPSNNSKYTEEIREPILFTFEVLLTYYELTRY